MSLAFMLTTLVIVATPGTGALFTIAAGLTRGARASVVAAVGCTIGIVPHMLAAIFGLAAILNASAIAFNGLKYLGVAYLLYLAWQAWQAWRDNSPLTVDGQEAQQSSWRVIRSAVLVNVLNPKLTIFFFAFLPQFVRPNEPDSVLHLLALSAVFMAVTLVIFTLYGVFAAGMRRHVISRPRVVRWMRRTFAATYVVLAARLAVQSR